jgi:hypothetical protein
VKHASFCEELGQFLKENGLTESSKVLAIAAALPEGQSLTLLQYVGTMCYIMLPDYGSSEERPSSSGLKAAAIAYRRIYDYLHK